MLASAIREFATSTKSALVAAAFFESTVQVWDLKSQTQTCEFPTLFSSGARNLALAADGRMLVAGLSTVSGGVASYEVPSGNKLWERTLNFPSRLQFDPTGYSILCTINRKSMLRIDASTGTTIELVDGIVRCIEGPYGDSLFVPLKEGGRPYSLIAAGRNFEISRLSFALLSAEFSPQSVCLAEAAGPVRCISRDDGRLQWICDPDKNSHVLLLHYSPRLDAFFGVLRHLNISGLSNLVRFDVTSGMMERVCDLDSWDVAFVDATDQLVTSSGEIRDLSDGALVGRLSFPLREYPDE
jgi:WD40 repeat protein